MTSKTSLPLAKVITNICMERERNKMRPGLESPQMTLKVTNSDQKQDNALTGETEKDGVDAPFLFLSFSLHLPPSPRFFLPPPLLGVLRS